MPVVLLALFLSLPRAQEPLPVSLDGFALGEQDAPEADAEAVHRLGPAPDDRSWRHGRCRFALDGEVEAGRWALCLGKPGMEISASLNGAPLSPLLDAQAGSSFQASPCFNVPAVLLQVGSNDLQFEFTGPEGGRGFLDGVATLYPPSMARRLAAQLANPSAGPPLSNLRIEAARGKGASLVTRIALGRRAGSRALAILDVVANPEEGVWIGADEIEAAAGSGFPRAAVKGRIGEIDRLEYLQTALAPFGPDNPRLALRPWILGRINFLQGPRGGGSCPLRIHCFALEGGPLRAVEAAGGIVLHNRDFALWCEGCDLVGTEEAPIALALDLSSSKNPSAGSSLLGPSAGYAFFQIGKQGSVEQQVAILVRRKEATEQQTLALLKTQSAVEPPPGCSNLGDSGSLLERSFRELGGVEGGWSLDDGDLGSALSFWSGSWPCWQFPVTEESTLGALLASQGEDGALFASGSMRRRLLGTLYAVLRVDRYLDATGDPDFLDEAHRNGLWRALDWTRASMQVPPPREEGDPALLHLLWAQLAAHEGLHAALLHAGRDGEAEELGAHCATLRGALTDADDGEECSLLEELYAFLLADLPDEARTDWVGRLESRRPTPPDSVDLPEVLLIHALLRAGKTESALPRLQALDAAVADPSALPDGVAGATMDMLVRGYGGFEIEHGTEISVLPRCSYKQVFAAQLRIAGASLSLRLGPPDVQFRRSLSIQNLGDLDLRLRLGVPGFLGAGERIITGEIRHSLYDWVIPAGGSHQESVR